MSKIANLDVKDAELQTTCYSSSNNTDCNTPSEQQLEIISSALTKNGYTPYIYNYQPTNDCYLACAYVPRLERFYNITKSTPVLPMKTLDKMHE